MVHVHARKVTADFLQGASKRSCCCTHHMVTLKARLLHWQSLEQDHLDMGLDSQQAECAQPFDAFKSGLTQVHPRILMITV